MRRTFHLVRGSAAEGDSEDWWGCPELGHREFLCVVETRLIMGVPENAIELDLVITDLTEGRLCYLAGHRVFVESAEDFRKFWSCPIMSCVVDAVQTALPESGGWFCAKVEKVVVCNED